MLGMNNVEADCVPPQSASRSSDRCVSHYRVSRASSAAMSCICRPLTAVYAISTCSMPA